MPALPPPDRPQIARQIVAPGLLDRDDFGTHHSELVRELLPTQALRQPFLINQVLASALIQGASDFCLRLGDARASLTVADTICAVAAEASTRDVHGPY